MGGFIGGETVVGGPAMRVFFPEEGSHREYGQLGEGVRDGSGLDTRKLEVR